MTQELINMMGSYRKLTHTLLSEASENSCLRAWSRFIRLRDGNRCVACHSGNKLAAHHICRKSFLHEARFLTGNGITLCKHCHLKAHFGFNGKPNIGLPMDTQGGEKIEILTELYGLLLKDAANRKLLYRQFYYLSNSVLSTFKMLQGFDVGTEFPGGPLEQAFTIWNQAPFPMTKALLEANGVHNLDDGIVVHIRL